MGDKTRCHVTHSVAPEPDHRKVEAALELWAEALAERRDPPTDCQAGRE